MLKAFKCIVYLVFLLNANGYSQDSDSSNVTKNVKVFFECEQYSELDLELDDYLRTSIDFVDFVNESKLADVHIILLNESAGNGGFKYSIWFNGITYKSIPEFTLNVFSLPEEALFSIRSRITNSVIKGLVPFLNKDGRGESYVLKVEKSDSEVANDETIDKWNSWMFKVTGSGGFDMEEMKKGHNYSLRIMADRVTEKFKINNYAYLDNRVIDYADLSFDYVYKYRFLYTKAVYSLSDHWSTGLTFFGSHSTYRNTDLALSVLQAIEFNVFPWDESNKHILSFTYALGYEDMLLMEQNILGNSREHSAVHRFYIIANQIEPWGEINLSATGSQYLNNFDYYSLSLESDISFRLAKGLSLTFSVIAKTIHDELFIPKSAYSDDVILSNSKKLPSTYELSGSVGLTFQFGSIYNSVVNHRL